MTQSHLYDLPVSQVAKHYDLSARTIRAKLKSGQLKGVQINRDWRCCWQDVLAAEKGPAPRGKRAEMYRQPLMRKKTLAAKWHVSERTVERWIADGLPTRNVFGSVRIAPADAESWIVKTFGIAGDAA